MERRKEFLDRYEHADFDESLHLYMQYRDLRNAFQEIELKRSAAKSLSVAASDKEKAGWRSTAFIERNSHVRGVK
jgi:hypothetical protein